MDVAAALALNVDSSKVVQAANDLDRFSASSEKAAAASAKVNFGRQSGSIAKLVATVQSMDSKLSSIVSSLDKLAAANDNVTSASNAAAASINSVNGSLRATMAPLSSVSSGMAKVAVSFDTAARSAEQADAHVLAYREHLRALPPAIAPGSKSLGQFEQSARAAGTAIKFTAQEGLNATRQLADIGTTALMGMSPFLIAIQQGPQLLDILQNKAALTGQTVGTVFRAAAVEVLAFLAPFLPLIALLAAAAAGIAALTAQANDDSGLKKYTTAMGYTKAEVAKLNAVTVTFGDTAKAVFQVGMRSIADELGISTADMAATWDSFLDHLISGTRAVLAGVYALFAGTRSYLAAIEKGGVKGIGKMLIGQGDPNLLKNSYGAAYADAQKGMDAIVAQARKNAQARQDGMAKGFYDAPKTPKGSKTDAEKLIDIYTSAKADIAVEKARELAATQGVSAEEAARLEKQTALLNTIQQRGIPITDAVRRQVAALADEYAKARTSADTTEAITSVTDEIERQRRTVTDQAELIGLYGDKLARVTREIEAQKRLRDSLPKGEIVVIPDLTSGLSDDIEANERAQRMADLKKASEDAAYAMDLERAGLGLTGKAALQYAFVTDQLNKARQAGIDLSPAEIAAINAAGAAYAAQRDAIDRQKQAISDAREVTKGFFTDWIDGVRQSGNLFKSFVNGVVNGLNKIIDKLEDKALTDWIDKIDFGSFLGGGSNAYGIKGAGNVYALGGTFGTAQRFAKGGAFTNRVITSPTMFRFARGAALGEMGEAGPEAVMPLKRGPNGSLGVQVHGGGGRPSVVINTPITIAQSGSFTTQDAQAMAVQAGHAAVNEVKKNLNSYMEEWQANGTVAV